MCQQKDKQMALLVNHNQLVYIGSLAHECYCQENINNNDMTIVYDYNRIILV